LNVAVTRAREELLVVSSIRAADLDLSATKAEGVRHLHAYLDFAERGMPALEPGVSSGASETLSPLEADVMKEVEKLGYRVMPQVGCGGYRMDLGVIDPKEPGRFLAGIECDGPRYHATPTARDRDRLRQEILGKLGWRLFRVWSPEWFQRRHQEVERLRETLEAARRSAAKPQTAVVEVDKVEVGMTSEAGEELAGKETAEEHPTEVETARGPC